MLRDRSRAAERKPPVVVKKSTKVLHPPQGSRLGAPGLGAPGLGAPGLGATVTASLMERYPPKLARPDKPLIVDTAGGKSTDMSAAVEFMAAPAPAPTVEPEPEVRSLGAAAAPALPPAVARRPPPVEIPVERFMDDLDDLLDESARHQASPTVPTPVEPRPKPGPKPGPKVFVAHDATPKSLEIIAAIEQALDDAEALAELKLVREELEELRYLREEEAARRAANAAAVAKRQERAGRQALAIPDPDPAAIDAITRMLMEEQPEVNKPPVKAAHLLAIICALHEERRPFPEREAAAKKIGSALSTIESILSHRLAEGYITMRVETREGNVNPLKRESVIRQKYYEPTAKLLGVYHNPRRQVRRKRFSSY
jgi:hypothetical protein